jgi:hypothetical protein
MSSKSETVTAQNVAQPKDVQVQSVKAAAEALRQRRAQIAAYI